MDIETEYEEDLMQCIDDCQRCHDVCLQTALQHCLKVGGAHAAPEHIALMLTCAEMCQTAANAMLRGSPLHRVTCQACGDICEACAASCQAVGDMRECIEMCRLCAESCHEMAEDADED